MGSVPPLLKCLARMNDMNGYENVWDGVREIYETGCCLYERGCKARCMRSYGVRFHFQKQA